MAKKEIVDELSTIDTQEIDPSQVVPKTENEIPKIKPEMGSKKLITGLVFGTVCLLILGFIFWKKGSSFSVNKFNQNRGSVSLDSKNQTFTAPNFQTTTYFAQYPIEQTPISPKIPPYEISVNELNNWSDFENENGVAFSQPQIDSLQTNHFFLTPNLDQFYSENPNDPNMRYDDWTHLYDEIGGSNSIYFRKPQDAVFITSDFLLHVYHRLLEKEMEYIEVTQFYPRLTQLSNTLLDQAIKHYNIADSPNDKASYERIITFFAVPTAMLNSVEAETLTNIPNQVDNTTNSDPDQKLDSFESALAQLDQLKNQIPKNAYKKAKEELEYIYESDDVIDSPLFADLSQAENMSFSHDYTQYTPRSHYNKNSVLRSYFRSMMWYGRQNFLLISDELTRDAVYITLLLDETDQFSNWSAIYEPTTFLVGKSDDLGLIEYASALKQADITQLDADSISSLRTELQAYDSAQIMSSPVLGQGVFEKSKAELQEMTQGFRFMGQRFTPDAFIFSSLTQGDEKADPETGEKLPSDTTALMVMSVLGNQTATPYRDDWISKQAPNSSKVLSKKLTELTNYFARLDQNQWTQNLYWSWLYTLKSLFSAPVTLAGYPEFMKKSLWNEKTLQTVLGSWTELKHDTLLYAKQSYAEFGAGGEGEIPPVPKGYVEPNIEFLDRLIALVKMTDQGLRQYDLLDPNLEGRNEKLIESLEFFRQIAVKQLQNQIISDDNFEQLRNEGGSLGYLMMPIFNEQPTEKSARSALVADVHTNIPEKNILYEANGIPHYIYVAIKDVNGTRLTKGLTYSYYEFHQPIDSRLTDEKWQSWQYRQDRSQVPPQPEWAQELLK